jgi:hypothetical protein
VIQSFHVPLRFSTSEFFHVYFYFFVRLAQRKWRKWADPLDIPGAQKWVDGRSFHHRRFLDDNRDPWLRTISFPDFSLRPHDDTCVCFIAT